MAFREIITGGACNAGDQQSAQINQNPFKNFINYMVSGKANTNQKLEGFYPQQQGGQLLTPEMQFNQLNHEFERAKLMQENEERIMNQQWNLEQKKFEQEQIMMNRMMQQQWDKEQAIYRQQMMEFAKNRENMWKDAEQKAYEEAIMQESKAWMEDYVKLENQNEKALEDAFDAADKEVDKELYEQEAMKEMSANMMETMLQDPDPKFQNSQFLQFLGKIKSGEFTIKDKQLIVNPMAQTENLENAFQAAEKHVEESKINPEEEVKLQAAWDDAQQEIGATKEDIDQIFENAWKQAEAGIDKAALREEMEREYKELLKSMNLEDTENLNDVLADAWQIGQEIEEQEIHGEPDATYQFQKANPYEILANPLEKAFEQLSVGNRHDAIYALESHLQKNPQDAKAWRLLGRLHQDNDQDRKALPCFLHAIKADPKDQETLLLLGVSCTNTLDEVQAMHHLKNWLLINPKFSAVKVNPDLFPESILGKDVEVKQLKEMYKEMIYTFEQARMVDPRDPDLLMSLAVMYFINRDYKQSVLLFNESLKFNPESYSLWNKLGATLAHLGRIDEAIDAYHRALELKPNFVRVWVNLGMAYAFKKDYEEAMRFYLNALTLNPDAKHIWGYFKTACFCADRIDLVKKMQDLDVNAFKDEFELIDPTQLPDPAIEYKLQLNELAVQKEANMWADSFKQARIDPNSEFDV